MRNMVNQFKIENKDPNTLEDGANKIGLRN